MNFLTARSPMVVSVNTATTNALEAANTALESNSIGSLIEQGGLITHDGEAVVSLPPATNSSMILQSNAMLGQRMEWVPRYISVQAVLLSSLELQTFVFDGPNLPNRFSLATTYKDVYSFNLTDIGIYSICGIFQMYSLESQDGVEYVFKTPSETLFHGHHMIFAAPETSDEMYAHTMKLGGYITIVNAPVDVTFSIRKMGLYATGATSITAYATEKVRLTKIA